MTVANVRVTQVLLKRGNITRSGSYVGALSELTHDTTLQSLRIHDGVTPGGWLLATNAQLQSLGNAIATVGNIDLSLLANAANQQQQIDLLNVNVASLSTTLSYGDQNVSIFLPTYTGDLSAKEITANTVTAKAVTANIVTANTINANIGSGTIGPGVHIPASANQIYVATNGSDSNDGSFNSPFLTIKAALDHAATIVAPSGVSVQVAPGIYHENNPVTIPPKTSLMGDNLRNVTVIPNTPSADLFYVTNGCYVWGITIKNYLANGFSYNPATPTQNVFVSPYIQNMTSSTTTGTAVYIDGSLSSAFSTKAMIVGFFTIVNQGGKGVHIINSGYSQLVNIYTIACDVGVKVESGAFCTLNGSDCSIGNYGLWAEGMGSLQTTGQTVGSSSAGTFTIGNLSPHLPRVNTVMMIDGDTSIYNIDTITPVDSTTATVVIQETFPSTVPDGTNISFYYRSAIVASAHTFEYVGAGTNPATALPQYGGIPIEDNEVVQIGGGKVTYTSTDHKGNFKIGSNLTINQGTGTISGDAFDRSLFALMTPYILALEI